MTELHQVPTAHRPTTEPRAVSKLSVGGSANRSLTVAAPADGNRLLPSRARQQAVSSEIPFGFLKKEFFSQTRQPAAQHPANTARVRTDTTVARRSVVQRCLAPGGSHVSPTTINQTNPISPNPGEICRGARILACRVAIRGDIEFLCGARSQRAASRLFSTPGAGSTEKRRNKPNVAEPRWNQGDTMVPS